MKIVSLKQLNLMPIGTVVSPVALHHDMAGKLRTRFDCQGSLRLEPEATVTEKNAVFLTLTDRLPNVHIDSGRVSTTEAKTVYGLNSQWPHRFVVWS